jgi:hypothetical protein
MEYVKVGWTLKEEGLMSKGIARDWRFGFPRALFHP